MDEITDSILACDELRLTPDETRAIAATHHEIDAASLQLLQQQSGGWAAGLLLLQQRLERTGVVQQPALPVETMQTVFGYFAEQVFDQLPAATRELLMRTVFLARIAVPAARSLTGNAEAETLLGAAFSCTRFETVRRVRTRRGAGFSTDCGPSPDGQVDSSESDELACHRSVASRANVANESRPV